MADTLRTDLRLHDPDAFYQSLIEAHRGLTDDQSQQLNARLILLLANHVGDREILAEAMAAARDGLAD